MGASNSSPGSPPVEELTLSDDETEETEESVQIFDISTAKQWFQLIEDGVPEDVALKLLEEEADAMDAPSQYKGCLNQISEDRYSFSELTKAECKVIGMYCTEDNRFYLCLNEDCRNRIWLKYRIYTSLLHSVCMKLRNRPFERREKGDALYRGLKCNLPRSTENDFCWPCFTSATTEKSIAERFGRSLIRLKSATGAPVKEFSKFFEYEILFSPFYVFKSRSQIYCSMPEESGFFLSFPYYRGTLLGAVVGNCLGSPFEFNETTTLENLLEFFSNLGKSNEAVHRYTCDTSMTQALARSLIGKKGLDIKNLSLSFVKEYSAEPDRNYGESVAAVLTELKQKSFEDPFVPAKEMFGGSGSHGNGGAMRVAPAALFFYKLNDRNFNEMVRKITLLTHSNINGVNGAILQAIAVKRALQFALKRTWQKDIRTEFLDHLIRDIKQLEAPRFSIGQCKPFCEKLSIIKSHLSSPPTLTAVRNELGNGMPALEAVPAAIYSFVCGLQPIPEIPSDYNGFERTIIFAISLGGDTDTIASMAGAIAGAYYGQDSIPQRWRDACEANGISEAKRYSKEIHNLVWK